MKLTRRALLDLKKADLIAHVVRLQGEVDRHEREDKLAPLRDVMVEISARAVGHNSEGRSAQAEEAGFCADLCESRLLGAWWLDVDALRLCKKDDSLET